MYFYFNNNSSESFKVILSDFPELPFVQEEIKTVEVGGKDGTLTKRTGRYKDLTISLECELLDIENYNEAIRNINNWLSEIEDNRLFFLDNPSKCYKVKKVTTGNIKNELNIKVGELETNCYILTNGNIWQSCIAICYIILFQCTLKIYLQIT